MRYIQIRVFPVYVQRSLKLRVPISSDAMKRNHLLYGSSSSALPQISEEKRAGTTYIQSAQNSILLTFTKEREAECIVDEFDPKRKSSLPLYEWITNTSGSFPTAENAMLKKRKILSLRQIYTYQKSSNGIVL